MEARMSKYNWSTMKYLRCRYHVWRGEQLVKKRAKIIKKLDALEDKIIEHTEKARVLIEEMKL
jgi:hypothetical protein